MASQAERDLLRALGERKRLAAEKPENKEKLKLWSDVNSLRKGTRPALYINEIPWSELEAAEPDALKARCQDPFLREVETSLRRELFQWERFRGDMAMDPFVLCQAVGGPKSSYADYGMKELLVRHEGAGDVQYLPSVDSLEDLKGFHTPEVWFDRAETARRQEALEAVFEGVIEVRRRGVAHQWHSPWDQIIHWYGIERLYTDMYEKPELVHETIRRFCAALEEVVAAQERIGLLDVGNGNWRVGSGGMGCVEGLPESVEGRNAGPQDQWGCACAQIFSEVSPEMHWEFSLQYELPLLSRYKFSYYGCCEPLHRKFELLRKIPNLRKISSSPKSKLDEFAAQAGRDYVVSWKPNPAILATNEFNEAEARKMIENALAKTQGCNLEIIMKDVTTVRNDPRRLERWERIAMEAIEGF